MTFSFILHSVLLLIGFVILYFSTKALNRLRNLLSSGKIAEAKVVDHKVSKGKETKYTPIYEYRTSSGRMHRTPLGVTSNSRSPVVGTLRKVIYAGDEKPQTKFFKYSNLVAGPTIGLTLGILSVLYACGWFAFNYFIKFLDFPFPDGFGH